MGNREHVYATLCGIYRRLGYYQQALDCAHKVTSPNLVTKLVYDVVDIHYKQGDIKQLGSFMISGYMMKTNNRNRGCC